MICQGRFDSNRLWSSLHGDNIAASAEYDPFPNQIKSSLENNIEKMDMVIQFQVIWALTMNFNHCQDVNTKQTCTITTHICFDE